jgi:hypothetical protein
MPLLPVGTWLIRGNWPTLADECAPCLPVPSVALGISPLAQSPEGLFLILRLSLLGMRTQNGRWLLLSCFPRVPLLGYVRR